MVETLVERMHAEEMRRGFGGRSRTFQGPKESGQVVGFSA